MNRLVCDVCGANIVVQEGGQIGVCDHCGANYSIGRMREIVSGIKVSQTGSAEDVEQWRELVQKYMDAGAFSDAENIVKKILEAIPNDTQANEQYDELQNLKYFDVRNGVLVKYNGEATKIRIPSVVKEIRADAFRDRHYSGQNSGVLEEIVFSEGCEVIDGDGYCGLFDGQNHLKSVKLPNSLKVIGNRAFRGCKSLSDLIMPEGLQTIGKEAFAECTSLSNLKFSEGLQAIGQGAFKNCTSLGKIQFPSGLQEISGEAFVGCTLLTEVKLPDNLQLINAGSFLNCTSLTEVKLPDGIRSIEMSAFSGCTSLEKIQFPSGLQKISDRAFENCTSLAEVGFPDSIQLIGSKAFFGCTSLKEVKLPIGNPFGNLYGEEDVFYRTKYLTEKNECVRRRVCPECRGEISFFGRCKKCGKQWK